jgi:hypothetical protein
MRTFQHDQTGPLVRYLGVFFKSGAVRRITVVCIGMFIALSALGNNWTYALGSASR